MSAGEIQLEDLRLALAQRSPEFADLVIAYSKQGDPPPGIGDDGSHDPSKVPPPDAWTLDRLRTTLHPNNLEAKDPEEQKALRRSAWEALLSSPWAPERLQLDELLIGLYGPEPDAWARNALVAIILGARIKWGLWRGLKTIYKTAELRHDIEIFGALAYRFDAAGHWQADIERTEVSGATIAYLRRRAWRHLRYVGQSAPEVFPEMAVQVLRHYPADHWMNGAWIAGHIFAHETLIGYRSAWLNGVPKKLEQRAFDAAWKLTPEPLLFLLEVARHEWVADFAIRSLDQDFEDALRSIDADWIRRLGSKPLPSTQRLVVRLLGANPEFHQSKLRGLGLHDMAVGLLRSSDEGVADYAIDYVKAHAPDLDVDFMLQLARGELQSSVAGLIRARLEAVKPEALGLSRILEMLDIGAVSDLAKKKLAEGFGPDDISKDDYVRAFVDGHGDLIAKLFSDAKQKLPTEYLVAATRSPDLSYWEMSNLIRELSTRKGADIGMEWFQWAIFDPRTQQQARSWLTRGALKGADLDVEWLKDLTRRPTMRDFALSVLGNREVVDPGSLGFDWLLRLLTRADPRLNEFARRALLVSFGPAAIDGGAATVWALTGPKDQRGKKRPDAQRQFAFDWLRAHHPDLSKAGQLQSLGVEPKNGYDDYGVERVEPLLGDASPAARAFAAEVARVQMVRWNDPMIPYRLADSRYAEARRVGVDALLGIGEKDAEMPLPAEWLQAERVFAMAESRTKSTRELALTMIRQHYDRIGGAEKLAQLMDSADREVRLFAVRLLWEKHRPGAKGEAFESATALRRFLRRVLFGLPPGRMERREGGAVDKPLASGTAKRRLVELVRDMGVRDAEFAAIVVPVLGEMSHSAALGEWQSCLAALAFIRAAHPQLEVPIPEGSVEQRAVREGPTL